MNEKEYNEYVRKLGEYNDYIEKLNEYNYVKNNNDNYAVNLEKYEADNAKYQKYGKVHERFSVRDISFPR